MSIRRKKNKIAKNQGLKEKKFWDFVLPQEIQKYVFAVIALLLAIIFVLSFFEKAGPAGRAFIEGLTFLIGRTVFVLPLILVISGLIFLTTRYRQFAGGIIIGIILLISGVSGILSALYGKSGVLNSGGWLGYLLTFPFLKFFGFWVNLIIFSGLLIMGSLIFWNLLFKSSQKPAQTKEDKKVLFPEKPKTPSLIRKIFFPKFKIKEIEEQKGREIATKAGVVGPDTGLKTKGLEIKGILKYKLPSLDLLDGDKGSPLAGDIRTNSAIIKKTLENFGIPVEMSEVNIGPTVTQYTLKPAEGIKLSKITTLNNDLSLALASHPIRIEAPIPGKSLVGIEIPNKVRSQVRLRELLSNLLFQNHSSNLNLSLGRDVSGNPIYADLAKMPHLLVAGSTGTGKTIFLNNLVISLLFRNSPEILRLILVDPKRVEFPVYNELPHLLCPVIVDSQKTVNVIKWLISEMERRFGILSDKKTRDIGSYNELTIRDGEPPLPYIVVIIDELADLMASRGKDVEAGIVRLAQMARAVGIHLVVATQRPSVEVITGLIKANITARITFQVASQVDSRTILDMAGAEKLLGQGDLLFVSAEIAKPKRIQGAYISEKEVKKVVNFIKTQNAEFQIKKIEDEVLENQFSNGLEAILKSPSAEFAIYNSDDPLLEEAKRMVVEAKKASASLLQRRLRIGYARAARLIDILEEKGIVGSANGAKPREILVNTAPGDDNKNENEEWQKI